MKTAASVKRYDQPQIKTKVDGKKIKFQLRKVTFAHEIQNLNVPADMRDLLDVMLAARRGEHEAIYNKVAIFAKLRTFSKFWETYGFRTESDFLIFYDISDGSALGYLTAIISIFDKETFLILGPQVLQNMMFTIGKFQADGEKCKEDFQTIFDQYQKISTGFDKRSFNLLVDEYVERKYRQPARVAQTKQSQSVGVIRSKNYSPSNGQLTETKSTGVFQPREQSHAVVDSRQANQSELLRGNVLPTIKTEPCGKCNEKIRTLHEFIQYTMELERIVKDGLGFSALPTRPALVKVAFKESQNQVLESIAVEA